MRCPTWLLGWLLGHDAGLSSRAIVAKLSGVAGIPVDSHGWAAPSDFDDVGRCVRVLDLAEKHGEGWRARMSEMSEMSPSWGRLVARWPQIETAYRSRNGYSLQEVMSGCADIARGGK